MYLLVTYQISFTKSKCSKQNLCELWIHIKCNNLNYRDCKYLQNCDKFSYCIARFSTIFPFISCQVTKTSQLVVPVPIVTSCSGKTKEVIIIAQPLPNLELLVNQFNNATPENINNPENNSSCKYYDIDKMGNIKISHKNKWISIFHINASSFDLH